jgi:hypothetical protein
LNTIFILSALAILCSAAFCDGQDSSAEANPSVLTDVSNSAVDHAALLMSEYLEKSCNAEGQFLYRINMASGKISTTYNIVRHAGVIYSLGMFNRQHHDQRAVDAMVRASEYLRKGFIYPTGKKRDGKRLFAVWNSPFSATEDPEADLGGAGLGLVALNEVNQVKSNSVPIIDLDALGLFIISLQRDDGRFYNKYSMGSGKIGDWQSLYYPGEALLGLISLYEADHSRQWLVAAGMGFAYLVKSQDNQKTLPADHWALMALARFLPYYDQSDCPISRKALIEHAVKLCAGILHEQIVAAQDSQLNGGFDPNGRTSPTSTRLEGLLAGLEFLPMDQAELRSRIHTAVLRGVNFVLRAQIRSGKYIGAIPETINYTRASRDLKIREAQQTVRIDAVQHALCVLLRYQSLAQIAEADHAHIEK